MKNTLTPEWKEAQKMMEREFSELAFWIFWDLRKGIYYWRDKPSFLFDAYFEKLLKMIE